MKFNKLTVGLGVLAVMFTACDKAAEQVYTPAVPVVTPPVYFPLDYEGEVILDEGQTSFTVPVYRGSTATAETVYVNCSVNGDFFHFQKVVGEGETPAPEVTLTPVTGGGEVEIPVPFNAGEDVAEIEISYDWATMEANKGKEFVFNFSTDGESTEYFAATAECTAIYVPWETVVGPAGQTTATWKDDALYSGFNVTGTDPVWEVEIEYNPITPGLYRILNPYEGAPQNSSGDDFRYHGQGMTNYMYINATDPDNAYLCDKVGRPLTTYHTYYTLSSAYSDISYFDCVSASLLGETFEGSAVSGSALGKREDFTDNGVTYVDNITFSPGHFIIFTDGYDTDSDGDLQIVFPGGQGKREWNDLGMADFTDGVMSFYDFGEAQTWSVPVQQNIDNPGVYRLLNPYTTYWPDGYPQDEDFNITIDCSNPQVVYLSLQASGYWIGNYDGYVGNAAAYFCQLLPQNSRWTEDQLIAQGMNDTYASGVISMPNAIGFAFDEDGLIDVDKSFFCSEVGSPGIIVKLPSGAGAPSYASAAAHNSTRGMKYAKKTVRPDRPLKAVRLFDIKMR